MGWAGGRRFSYAALFTLGVAGCTAFGGPPPLPCPVASIVSDASQATVFKDGPGRDLIDIRFEIEIDAIASDCDYNRAGDEITIRTGVRIVATRGPAAQDSDVAFSFFVAVVDRAQRVLARERFESALVFGPAQRRAGAVEEIEEVIPLPEGMSGANYEILVGIVLTADQLEFNRLRLRR
ncbi:MAG: hypothetical protein IIB66_02225 [Proteobacteria bacterium]|nr:hypothetical protein [Pseudomonadota bacterium]